MKKTLFLVFLCLSVPVFAAQSALFPFVLPWDDNSDSPTNLSYLLHKPAGVKGYLSARPDGHFYFGKDRQRFFGVNIAFTGKMPDKEEAKAIAFRMAKFGVNVVRFHHMDNSWEKTRIVNPDGRSLNPEAIDKLDYFIKCLKDNGIYSNINLLVSRPFKASDGIPPEIETIDWKDRAVAAMYYPKMIDLQKEYAKTLLTHKNPYTGLAYNEDPCVAFVEINNENGIIHAWLGGRLDLMPGSYMEELKKKWNLWLKTRYGSTDKMKEAWGTKSFPAGKNMIKNGSFLEGENGWVFEQHETAKIEKEFSAEDGRKCAKITVKTPGGASWHVQLDQAGLKLKNGIPYKLEFFAKADDDCEISVNAGMAHPPWSQLGFNRAIKLTGEWQKFEFDMMVDAPDDNGRICFSGMGGMRGDYFFTGVKLTPGGELGPAEGQKLEDYTVAPQLKSGGGLPTAKQKEAWLDFLWDLESGYWLGMYSYIKKDLGVKAMVTGTIAGCAPLNIMAQTDYVDAHAYWQHPQFPLRPWDPDNWFIKNESMVKHPEESTIVRLTGYHIKGKPYTVSEYDHPSPNTFNAETLPILAAYASFQDWDAIYAFAYSPMGGKDSPGKISGFFDLSQHPLQMASLVPSAAMFLRGDLNIDREDDYRLALEPVSEKHMVGSASPWSLIGGRDIGMPLSGLLTRRFSICASLTAADMFAGLPSAEKDRIYKAGKEIVWNGEKGILVVNSAKSKALIGYCEDKEYDLGEFTARPGKTLQEGWSVITITETEKSRRIITAMGYCENSKIGWKSPAKNSCGRDWGEAPTLVEGVPVTIKLKTGSCKVWALDEKGKRKSEIPVKDGTFELGPEWKTIWYEIN